MTDYQVKVYYEEIIKADSVEEAKEVAENNIRHLRDITIDVELEPFASGQLDDIRPRLGK